MFHVLIVDDERNIRRAYQADIEAASDRYRLADSLCSAKDAVMVCHTRPVDLVLMDVNTAHHENGLDAAQQIKAIRPQVKILIHTSYLDEQMIQQAQDIGADGLWFKDYSPDPLIDVMDRIMSGGHYWPDELP